MSALPRRFFTPEEYLLLENQAPYKSQYVAGEIYAMAGAEPEHTKIASNIDFALKTAFGERPCESYPLDQRVKIEKADLYTYPDVVAFCGEGRYDRSSRLAMLLNPQAIFEVLSPSTEAFDRGDKFHRYRTLESLGDYVLVSSERMHVEHYTLQPGGQWTLTEHHRPTDRVLLRSLEAGLTLAQIYRRVDFPGSPTAD